MSYCTNCKKYKSEDKFYDREDRDCKYSWCVDCMSHNGRSVDYPAMKYRGFGVIYRRYDG